MALKLPPEPADGTVLVVLNAHDERLVIWRDDVEAIEWDGLPDEHWFADPETDPMCWENINKYTRAMHLVSTDPIWER